MAFGCFVLGAGAITALSGLAFAKYMGFFDKIVVKDITYLPSYLIYTKYQGSYRNLMPTINSVKNDLHKFCSEQNDVPALAPSAAKLKTFGIYYDNYKVVVDQTKSRAIIGAMVPISGPFSESAFIELFERVKANSENEFHFAKFTEPITGFGSVFPLLNLLSILYAVWWGYPAITEYGIKNDLIKRAKFSMEVYDRDEKKLTICFPYQGDIEGLLLSDAPRPAYIGDDCLHKND